MLALLADFHFMYPDWLWLLLLLPLLWLRVVLRRQQDGSWSDLVDKQLAPFVLTGQSKQYRYRAAVVVSLLTVLAILAIAGPSWEKREIPAFRNQQSVVVGLDLSASMYVRDATPNRLDAARFKLLDLLKVRKDGQTGLVVFAGDAFVVSPLTDDTATVEAQVKNLSPEIMPSQGSNVDLAILRSIEVLDQATPGDGSILLITDGTNDVRLAREAAQQAVAKGYTVSVLAIGSEAGAPIPMNNGGFLTDSTGKTVMPRLDKAALKAISSAGEGVFSTFTVNDQDINTLMAHWENLLGEDKLVDEQERQLDIWFNQGIWLVVLLVPLAMLLFRRGWLTVFLMAFLLSFLLPRSEPVYASVWADLWLTPDQQGQRAMQKGDAASASELFNSPNWQATAAYRAGDYAKAATLFAQDSSVNGLYNYGNALAMQGKLAPAIAAYEAVLEQQPNHEDAKFNLEMLKKKQEEQQQQQQQGQQNQQNNNSQQQGENGRQSPNANNESAQSGEEQQANPGEEQEEQNEQASEQQGEGEQESQSEQEAEGQEDAQTREQKQATEQWLRLIPDDPAGLWRRKFQYQYRKRNNGQQPQGDGW